MGFVAEKRIKKLILEWPSTSPFSVQIVDYKRGWFTSTMKFAVTLKTATANQPLNFEINEVVVHGPFIIDLPQHFIGIGQAYAAGEITVPADQQAFFKQYVEQTDLLKNSIFLELFGSVAVGFDIPELNITDPATPGMRMTLEGLSTRATVSSGVTHISSHSSVQEISWQHADNMITLENLSGKSNLKKTSQGLWLGDIHLGVDSLVVNQAKKILFSLSKAEYKSSSEEKDGLVSGKNYFSLDKLTINGVTYGPAKLGINIANVNAAPLAQLKKLSQSMQAQNNMVVVQQGDIRKQKLIFKIIARGMQLSVMPLSVQTPNGDITGQLNISMPNLLEETDGKPIKNPRITIPDILGGIKADVQLSVPKVIAEDGLQSSILHNMQALSHALSSDANNAQALVTAAQQRAVAQLQGWVAAGLLLEKGDNYEFAATFDQDKFMINGKSVFNPALGAASAAMAASGGAMPAAAPTVIAPVPASTTVTVSPAPANTTVTVTPATTVTPVAESAPATSMPASTPAANMPTVPAPTAAPAPVPLPGSVPAPAAAAAQ